MHEAKTQLSKLVERAAAGEEIVIGRAGRPVARLVPFTERPRPRAAGTWAGRVWIADDFGDPLPDEVLDAFEGR